MRFFPSSLAFFLLAWLGQASQEIELSKDIGPDLSLAFPKELSVVAKQTDPDLSYSPSDIDRKLQLADQCALECPGNRHKVTRNGNNFKAAVSGCLSGSCPYGFKLPINCWDVSRVKDMYGAFEGLTTFNEPLHCWDTSGVTLMGDMFKGASAFNQPIDSWNTGSVTAMHWMFYGASAFNQPIGSWNTGAVNWMWNMFLGASAFNQPLNEWNVASVTHMEGMFQDAISFNQPLREWNIGAVTDARSAFKNASAFNQCLGTWTSQVDSSVSVTDMFLDSGCAVPGTPVSSASYWCNEECAKPFGTHKVARAKVNDKSAEVLTLEPFNMKTFFEAKDLDNIALELYINVPSGEPCTNGTALGGSLYSTSTMQVSTANGTTIYAAEYTITNVANTVAYTSKTDNTGEIALCARAAKKLDIDTSNPGAEYLSFVDTKLNVTVDLDATFQNFTQSVTISYDDDDVVNTTIIKNVDVEGLLCAAGRPADFSYKMGDEFGICVRPTAEYLGQGYSVTGFVDVVCSNNAAARTLFNNSATDLLTRTLDVSVARDTSGTPVGSQAAGFVSIVTAGYFGKLESTFTCSGKVSLSFSPGIRRLSQPFTFSGDDMERLLQEGSDTSPFASTIALEPVDTDAFIAGGSLVGGMVALILSFFFSLM